MSILLFLTLCALPFVAGIMAKRKGYGVLWWMFSGVCGVVVMMVQGVPGNARMNEAERRKESEKFRGMGIAFSVIGFATQVAGFWYLRDEMPVLLQQMINGLSMGAIYALIALGYTMVYGVLRFINFAHSDIFMVGSFVGFYVAPKIEKALSLPSFTGALVVLLVAMACCGILGMTIERLAYRPLRNSSKLTVLITAIGVSLFLEYGGQKCFGADFKPFPELITDTPVFDKYGLTIQKNQVIVFVITFFLMISLQYIVLKTKIGTAMRAVAFNSQAAALMGVNINTIISFTFGLGSALAGAGGILYAMNYPSIDPLMGIMPGLKAFVAAVLGGIGNIPGAALGGLIIGIIETFVAGSEMSTYRDAVAFAILILILLFKPSGILGKVQIEKV